MFIRNFIIRLIINAIALAITASILPGITIAGGTGTLLLVALVFGVVNAVVKPIIAILTCPMVILTLGLFILVINGLMLLLTSSIVGAENFAVDGFGTALIGGIVMGVLAIIVEAVLDALGLDESK